MAKKILATFEKFGALLLMTGLLLLGGLLVLGSVDIGYAKTNDDATSKAIIQSAEVPGQQTCVCSREDVLNCSDFANQDEAQACFSQCLDEDGYDVHDLDRDNDGLACEIEDDRATGAASPAAPPEPVEEEKECNCRVKNLDCSDFADQSEAQSCFNLCRSFSGRDYYGLDSDGDSIACEVGEDYSPFGPQPGQSDGVAADTPAVEEEPVEGANNLIFNGNFEFGFYQVPELGFEPPDVGNVPNNWGWYKSNTYGKVNIYNNEGFGLVCRDDRGLAQTLNRRPEDDIFGPIPGVVFRRPNNSVSLHMQSTDQMDMRLGIYQTVNVVPGQDYRFTMSGTVQVQSGATTLQPDDPNAPREAQNHTLEISFDHTGGTNWRAIPLHRRNIWELGEQKLEFKVSETDEDIAEIQDFETFVRARSDKMTVFITGWRKWANWRTSIFTFDCVSLEPVGATGAIPAASIQDGPSPSPASGPSQQLPTTGNSQTELDFNTFIRRIQEAGLFRPH